MDNQPFRLLALAGILQQRSYNRGLLRATEELAPEWVEVQFFDIGTLPFFNEDLEAVGDPEAVRRFKAISTFSGVFLQNHASSCKQFTTRKSKNALI